MGRIGLFAFLALTPALALAQPASSQLAGKPGNTQGAAGQGGAQGQQMNQAIPNQNQSQMETNNSQQPPQVKVLPPTTDSQNQPNPKPELSQ